MPDESLSTTGWRISGFRKVAHLIYEAEPFLKARCGTFWWLSDGLIARAATADTRLCKRCQRRQEAHDAT